MDRAGARTSREVLCPECEAELDGRSDVESRPGHRALYPLWRSCRSGYVGGCAHAGPRPVRLTRPRHSAASCWSGGTGCCAFSGGCTGPERSSDR